MNALISRKVESVEISQDASNGYVNATAMCSAAGKKFNDYRRLAATEAFLGELSAVTGIPATELVSTVQGGRPELQGTWVHPDVAINLGQWCSPKFAVAVSQWVREWMSGKYQLSKPARARKSLPHQTEAWLETREETKTKRKLLTGTLASHAVRDRDGFSVCTNAVYDSLFGRTAAELKDRRGLKKSALLREYMSATALLAVGLTEALAMEKIEERDLQGAYRCQEAIQGIGLGIAKAAGGKLRPFPQAQLTA